MLALSEATRKELSEGRLSAGHARSLLSISDPQAQERLKNLIIDRHLSVREAEGLAAAWKENGTMDCHLPIHGLIDSNEENAEKISASVETKDKASLAHAENHKSRPQSARLLEIQTSIGNALNLAVRVTGKEEKGKISLSYNSKAELNRLLDRLAGSALAGKAQTFEGDA